MVILLTFNNLTWGQETPPGNRNGKRYSDAERKRVIFYRTFCFSLLDILQYWPLSDVYLKYKNLLTCRNTGVSSQHEKSRQTRVCPLTHLSRAFLLVGTRPSHSKVRPSGDQLCGLWWRPMYCWFPERWWVLVSVPDIFCDVAPFLFLIWSRCLVLLCTTVLKT